MLYIVWMTRAELGHELLLLGVNVNFCILHDGKRLPLGM